MIVQAEYLNIKTEIMIVKRICRTELSIKTICLRTAGVCACMLLLFFFLIGFRHQIDTLTQENERLIRESHDSIRELRKLSGRLNQIAQVTYHLNKLDFEGSHHLFQKLRVTQRTPENIRPEPGPEATEQHETFTCPSFLLKSQTEKLREKSDLLLSFLDKTRHSIRERSQQLHSIPTIMPVTGRISSRFGVRKHPLKSVRCLHKGIDISAPNGTPVVATAAGIVRYAGRYGTYGYLVQISHGRGLSTRYAHNSVITVRKGDSVRKGQIIAKVGSSGASTAPHSHYEILLNKTPVDPELFIDSEISSNHKKQLITYKDNTTDQKDYSEQRKENSPHHISELPMRI